jgi:hypothetical protein
MRLIAVSVLASLVLAGCQAQPPTTPPQPSARAEQGLGSAAAPAPSFDGWAVQVSVEPGEVGPIEVTVGPPRAAPRSNARPWVQHDLVFHNRGDRPVTFEDTRRSLFLRRDGRPVLLVADRGCGYEKRAKRVVPGVCLLYLDNFTLRPASTGRRDVTLFKDLRGMEGLTAGTYVWDKVIRFRVGSAEAPVRTATIRLTYTISPLGG